jgi:hypothetical protein
LGNAKLDTLRDSGLGDFKISPHHPPMRIGTAKFVHKDLKGLCGLTLAAAVGNQEISGLGHSVSISHQRH